MRVILLAHQYIINYLVYVDRKKKKKKERKKGENLREHW